MPDQDPPPRRKPGPQPSGVLPSRLTLKSGPRWHDYMTGLAAHVGLDKVMIVDRGIDLYARSIGYPPPPSRYE